MEKIDAKQIEAVCKYLQAEFEGCKIDKWEEPRNATWGFIIRYQGSNYFMSVVERFFLIYHYEDIPAKLEEFFVADLLRKAGKNRIVFVAQENAFLQDENTKRIFSIKI